MAFGSFSLWALKPPTLRRVISQRPPLFPKTMSVCSVSPTSVVKRRLTMAKPWAGDEIKLYGLLNKCNWLVGAGQPSEKYDFVNWDDEIPNIYIYICGKIKNGNQTTNRVKVCRETNVVFSSGWLLRAGRVILPSPHHLLVSSSHISPWLQNMTPLSNINSHHCGVLIPCSVNVNIYSTPAKTLFQHTKCSPP